MFSQYSANIDWTTGLRSPAKAKDFPLASVSRPALRPTQPPVQWVPAVLSQSKARSERDGDQSPSSNAEVKNE
jgi:hypothetical protein